MNLIKVSILSLMTCIFFWLTHSQVFAIRSKQIMRNIGLLPRSIEIAERAAQQSKIQSCQYKRIFLVHNKFVCYTQTLTDFDLQSLAQYQVTSDKLRQDPVFFGFIMQIIRAHLEISFMLYAKNGINMHFNKYEVWSHNPHEKCAYDNFIAHIPAHKNKVHIPDSVRTIAYIDYVILPVIKPFMQTSEHRLFKKIIQRLWFKDVLVDKQKRQHMSLAYFQKDISLIDKLLYRVEKRYLNQHKLSWRKKSFQVKILSQLMAHHWLDYQAVNSCGLVTPSADPAYDQAFYLPPFVSRKNFLMAYGIFKRIQRVSKHYLDAKYLKIMQPYLTFFQTLYAQSQANHTEGAYKSVKPTENYWLKFSQARKQHQITLCHLNGRGNPTKCFNE